MSPRVQGRAHLQLAFEAVLAGFRGGAAAVLVVGVLGGLDGVVAAGDAAGVVDGVGVLDVLLVGAAAAGVAAVDDVLLRLLVGQLGSGAATWMTGFGTGLVVTGVCFFFPF